MLNGTIIFFKNLGGEEMKDINIYIQEIYKKAKTMPPMEIIKINYIGSLKIKKPTFPYKYKKTFLTNGIIKKRKI